MSYEKPTINPYLNKPGSALEAILRRLGIPMLVGCKCKERKETMDSWGTEECKKKRELVISWLREESGKISSPKKLLLGIKGITHTKIGRKISPFHPIETIVDLAIEISEKEKVDDLVADILQ